MALTKANKLSQANPTDFPARVTEVMDESGVGFGDSVQSLCPAASLGGKAASGWAEGIVVAGDFAVLPQAGIVVTVASTAGAPGAKAIQPTAPSAGQCQVAYDANGVPTLTFAGADSVTACAVMQVVAGVGASAKLSKNA